MVPSLSPCPSCFYPFQLLRSVCFCLCPAPFSFLPSLPAVLLLHTQTPNIVSLLYIIDTICFSPCPSRSGINPFLSPAALYPSLFADLPGGIGVFPLRVPPRKNTPAISPAYRFFQISLPPLSFSKPFPLSPKFSKLPSSKSIFSISKTDPLKPTKIAKLDSD